MMGGNEKYMNVDRYACQDIVCTSNERLEKFIRELHELATHVNIWPNSLGRMDKNKIKDSHRQLHPSMIGKVDLLESSKDVGQSGMISPWGDLTEMAETDKNRYPNVSYELFMFIQQNFPDDACIFHAKSLEELNRILDKLVYYSTLDLTYHAIPPKGKQ